MRRADVCNHRARKLPWPIDRRPWRCLRVSVIEPNALRSRHCADCRGTRIFLGLACSSSVTDLGMADMAGPMRRNITAHLTPAERQEYIDAVLQADLQAYSDGVSYWDKQDQIHQCTHNHGGNSFIPWHRELVNRYESCCSRSKPDMALHYWDWTQDPRAAVRRPGRDGGLCTDTSRSGRPTARGGTSATLHNGGVLAGSRERHRRPRRPAAVRGRARRARGIQAWPTDTSIIHRDDGDPQAQQWMTFRQAVESSHDTAHTLLRRQHLGQHQAFEDPFVFLLHRNVDRLFAMWQTAPGEEWRLDPGPGLRRPGGHRPGTAAFCSTLQPWDGTVEFGSPIAPWIG